MVTSLMARLTPAALIGSHSMSEPTASTSLSIRWMVEASVNSRSGSPSAAGDAQPLGAGREVAAHRVDARVQAGHRGRSDAVAHLAEDLVLAERTRESG